MMIAFSPDVCTLLLAAYLAVNAGTPLCGSCIAADVHCSAGHVTVAAEALAAQGSARVIEFPCVGCGVRRAVVVGLGHR
jgi:hypothetical protein